MYKNGMPAEYISRIRARGGMTGRLENENRAADEKSEFAKWERDAEREMENRKRAHHYNGRTMAQLSLS